MNTGEIYARITQMRDAASAINRSAARIQESIDAVDNEVRALGADRFLSANAETFRAEYNRLTPRLREAADLLAHFQNKLNLSADDIELASRTMPDKGNT
jgi:WXG100 family type VII secretion target